MCDASAIGVDRGSPYTSHSATENERFHSAIARADRSGAHHVQRTLAPHVNSDRLSLQRQTQN
jgi:hypothetical protein